MPTAQRVSFDPGWDFLEQVPFEPLYRDLIAHACSTIELAVGHHGKNAVAAVLRSLPICNPLSAGDQETFNRRASNGDVSLLNDALVEFDWQEIAANLAGLFTFARHGEARFPDPEDSRAEIDRIIRHFQRLVADPGVRAILSSGFEWFSETLAAAEARWAIDNGRPVMPEALAALAGVKAKTLANLTAAGQLRTDGNGNISAAEALQYLSRRKGFIPSTWQIESSAPPTILEELPLPEQIFVPVDADGGPFLPSLARRGRDGQPRYIIGEKSSPIYLEDYWEALARLAEMQTPRWRRPASGTGGWSLVSAQDGWRRFAKADIQRMLAATRPDSGDSGASTLTELA
jgi:hypothetical protein